MIADAREKQEEEVPEEIPRERRGTAIEVADDKTLPAEQHPIAIPALAEQLAKKEEEEGQPTVEKDDDFEVAVVTSRQWEAQPAGKEIAESFTIIDETLIV